MESIVSLAPPPIDGVITGYTLVALLILFSFVGLVVYLRIARQAMSARLLTRLLGFRLIDGERFKSRLMRSREARRLLDQLDKLGGISLGVVVESAMGIGSIKSLVIALPERRAFVSIALRWMKVCHVIYTRFSTGEVLLTANRFFKPIKGEGCIVETIPSTNLWTLLDIHHNRLQSMKAKGGRPYTTFTQESNLEAKHLFYGNPVVLRWMRAATLRAFVGTSVLLLATLVGIYLSVKVTLGF